MKTFSTYYLFIKWKGSVFMFSQLIFYEIHNGFFFFSIIKYGNSCKKSLIYDQTFICFFFRYDLLKLKTTCYLWFAKQNSLYLHLTVIVNRVQFIAEYRSSVFQTAPKHQRTSQDTLSQITLSILRGFLDSMGATNNFLLSIWKTVPPGENWET